MLYKLKNGGAVTVTTAATRVQVTATATIASMVTIQALKTNTGKIYVGDSAVAAANGIALDPGQSVNLTPPADPRGGSGDLLLSDLYIDSSVNGEKATFHYWIQNR